MKQKIQVLTPDIEILTVSNSAQRCLLGYWMDCVFRFVDSESDIEDLSKDDLVKLVVEKEDLLKVQEESIKEMKDKVLRTYAEMENLMDRTKRNAESAKKFAIQVFTSFLANPFLACFASK